MARKLRRAGKPRLSPKTVDILRRLDLAAARQRVPGYAGPRGGVKPNGARADPDEVALASLHKLRVFYRRVFTRAEVELSRNWLQRNGWNQGFGDENRPSLF